MKITCKNCGNVFEGNYCNNCGQNANVKKVSWHYLLSEIKNSVLQIDHGLLFTIKKLFTQPGNSIRNYLDGKRKQYYKPLAFVFVLSTAYALLAHYTHINTYLGDGLSGVLEGLSGKNNISTTSFNVLQWMANNYVYSVLIFLPFFSFSSYLAFRKLHYNFIEHLILNAYIFGAQTIIYLLFIPFNLLLQGESYIEFMQIFLFPISYTCWTFLQFFNRIKLPLRILRIALTYLLYIIQLIVFIFIIFVSSKL